MTTQTTAAKPDEAARVAPDHHVFHVWQEGVSYFEGNAIYLDLETAKSHGAKDYEEEEYGTFDPAHDDPSDRPVLTWTNETGVWELLDGETGTGVRIDKRPVYRPATPEEIAEQDRIRAEQAAEAAREAAARYAATPAA